MERNRQTCVAWILFTVGVFCPSVWGKYGGGSGTAADPYLISTAEHLRSFSVHRSDWRWDGYYKLTADIDLSELAKPIEPMGTPEFPFMGDFDGNGKTVSNLQITRSSGDDVGLFGYSNATIHDLRLVNVNIDAAQSKSVGALVGRQAGNGVRRCYVDSGAVLGGEEVGGLIGSNCSAVTRCYAACNVSGSNKVGGLVGWQECSEFVDQCYSIAAVSGSQSVGGLVGANRGVLRDCYAVAEVRGGSLVGGLVGSGWTDGQIWDCYAAGPVSATGSAAGLSSGQPPCFSSFWDTETTGQTSSLCGNGRTTAEMHQAVTFRGWGRGAAWTINEGADYPRLAWENKGGTPLATPAFPGNEGRGTAQSPYLIHTLEELNAIGDLPGEWDKHYRLESDIDLAGLGGPFNVIGCESIYFTGTFNGDGHSISNFQGPHNRDSNYLGLFGFTRGATVKRLTLVNPSMDFDWSLSIGPLIGQQVEGIVEGCGVEGGSASGSYFVGGLVGRCCSGTIARCYSTCRVMGRNVAEDVGGLVGRGDRCSINNSYATGNVDGGRYVGGLAGRTEGGTVSHCYAIGAVVGSRDTGGLIGVTIETFVAGCFWDIQTSGCAASAAGQGLVTAALQNASTFILAGWDFQGESGNGTADIWSIAEGRDYPRFSSGPPPQHAWADDFEDGEPAPLWRVCEPIPGSVHVRETGGRLEVLSPVDTGLASAVYLAAGWGLDGTQDFALKIDFQFHTCGEGEGWLSVGLVPSVANPVAQYVELTATCSKSTPLYTGRLSDGNSQATWQAARSSDSGTLYLSYDAERDELYRSFTGYGPVNAWHIATGLLKGQWAGKPVFVILGGGSEDMSLDEGDAWLDNFVLETGAVLE